MAEAGRMSGVQRQEAVGAWIYFAVFYRVFTEDMGKEVPLS